MKLQTIDPAFDSAFKALLERQATENTRPRPGKITIIAGVSLGLLALGGTAAVAGGLLSIPGSKTETVLSTPVSTAGNGTQTVALAAAPADATTIRVELECLSAGTFTLPSSQGTLLCTDADAAAGGAVTSTNISVEDAGSSLTVTAAPGETWRLSVTYLDSEVTPLGVNANGDTFGIADSPQGTPDLIAVIATNGEAGYVYADELAEADGTEAMKTFKSPEEALAWQAEHEGQTTSLPVYLSDGSTVVGEFVVG